MRIVQRGDFQELASFVGATPNAFDSEHVLENVLPARRDRRHCAVFETIAPARLNEREVRHALGTGGKPIASSTFEKLLRTDPDFPRPIMFFRTRQWLADEVAEWLNSRPRRQYCGADVPMTAA